MAEVAIPGHHRYPDSIGNMATIVPLATSAPDIQMTQNPDFSFPRIPPSTPPAQLTNSSAGSRRRPQSIHMPANESKPRSTGPIHRRGGSALPSFSFNATDASGRIEDEPEPAPTTMPSRSTNHKRQSSTFVGGHGVADAISSSPTKSSALPVPRRSHGRVNSRVTLSGQEWSKIMNEAEPQPRLSSSLPNSPLDHPGHVSNEDTGYALSSQEQLPETPPSDDSSDGLARPPSRPRVEFSDNVEYIPRPLSTISSETGSSMSTLRGHSVNNSISSVLSMTSPSPPTSRARATSLETTPEDEPRKAPRSSIEISKRIEREGQWLRGASSRDSLKRPITEPVPNSPKLTFSAVEPPKKQSSSHKKRQSIGHALGFDRRRSEPAIGNYADEPSCLSALSLQEPSVVSNNLEGDDNLALDNRSSSRKLKDWAKSKMTRKARPHSVYLATPEHPQAADASPVSEPAAAETDLDAVFSLDSEEVPTGRVRAQPAVAIDASARHTWSSPQYPENDDYGTMLDLDAALGPFPMPSLSSQKPRRELHSSRGTRDFGGPGGHYQPNPNHRRTESAPMLTPFDYNRTSTSPQASMADVFEEEEEEDDLAARNMRANSAILATDEEAGMGVEIVDSDISANSSTRSLGVDDGLRIQNSQWEAERPSTAYGNLSSRLFTPMLDRRASVIEDTIEEEEIGPVEPEIVEAYEEPRAQSLTKSSDSSETPTILAAQTDLLALPDGQPPVMTPETYNSSIFSSPDLGRRQSSFETSRLGTSASSMTDNRTMSSCTTGEPTHDVRVSVDDVPSLTSSRSTMMSTLPANSSRRDVSGLRTPSVNSSGLGAMAYEQRRKRNSIQSLSQLMTGSFGPRAGGVDGTRPQTATDALTTKTPKKKEHNRLKKLMFWKSKHRQASSSTVS